VPPRETGGAVGVPQLRGVVMEVAVPHLIYRLFFVVLNANHLLHGFSGFVGSQRCVVFLDGWGD
jgi:hypothetical protein